MVMKRKGIVQSLRHGDEIRACMNCFSLNEFHIRTKSYRSSTSPHEPAVHPQKI